MPIGQTEWRTCLRCGKRFVVCRGDTRPDPLGADAIYCLECNVAALKEYAARLGERKRGGGLGNGKG